MPRAPILLAIIIVSHALNGNTCQDTEADKWFIFEFSTIAFLLFVQVKRRFQKFSTEYSTYVEKYLE